MSRGGPAALAVLVLVLVLTVAAAPARAQDDGPRVYQLAPVGAQNLTAFLVNKRGNETPEPGSIQPGADIDTDILVLRWAGTFDLAGRPLTPFVIVPVGQVNNTGFAKSSGFGDAQVGASLGLVGAPALSPEAFAAYEPGFGLSVLGRIYFPTGEYSAGEPVNLGSNRYAWSVGLPTVYVWSRSYRDPRLTTLEVLPSLTFYDANEDPFGADRSEKDPLLTVEAHLTHNLSPRVWLSADVLYRQGGETTTGGVPNHNATDGWSAGGSLALPFVATTVLIFTYQHVIERRDTGPDGWFFRTALVAPF